MNSDNHHAPLHCIFPSIKEISVDTYGDIYECGKREILQKNLSVLWLRLGS